MTPISGRGLRARLHSQPPDARPAWETDSGDVDVEVLERGSRETFEFVCATLAELVEAVDDLPYEMITKFRGPSKRAAKAIVRARREYDHAVAVLADADRIRALQGVEFVRQATAAMQPLYDQPEVSEAEANEVIAEARAIKKAKRRPGRMRLPRW